MLPIPVTIFKQSLVEDGKFILYQMNIITRFVTRATRRVPLVDQELLTLPELTPVFSGVRVVRSLVFCVVFCRSLFVIFLLTIVLFVLRFTDTDYHFGNIQTLRLYGYTYLLAMGKIVLKKNSGFQLLVRITTK
jgi:hypothetical protein